MMRYAWGGLTVTFNAGSGMLPLRCGTPAAPANTPGSSPVSAVGGSHSLGCFVGYPAFTESSALCSQMPIRCSATLARQLLQSLPTHIVFTALFAYVVGGYFSRPAVRKGSRHRFRRNIA